MRKPVREDHQSQRNGSGLAWHGFRRGLLLVALSLGLVSASWAQPDSRDFTADIVDTSSASRSLSIPLNRSVIVKTSVEVASTYALTGEIVDVAVISPTELLLTGRGYGQTNIVLTDAKDKQYVLDVTVELDVEALNEALQAIDPQGSPEVKPMLGNLVLSGTVSSGDRAQRMVDIAQMYLSAGDTGTAELAVQNHLDIAGEQQVMLRCVVAEVNRSAARQLGVNGFLAGESFGDGFIVNQLGGINPINIGAAADAAVTGRIPFLTGTDGIPLSATTPLSLGFPNIQMQLFIRALADNSLLKILAEPNLVAISGETATFLAGGEFPIPVPQGLDQVTAEFREFGVRLNFTPVVRDQQKIRIRVAPEVSELDFSSAVQVQGFVIPGLTTRSAETTIELTAGQTIAIAGLLSESTRSINTRVPGVGDIPVLGALFRSVEYRSELTELVILVTPEIVAPLDPFQVPELPGSDHIAPTNWELYGLGKIGGTKQDEPMPPGQDEMTLHMQSSQQDHLGVHGPWGWAPGRTPEPASKQ